MAKLQAALLGCIWFLKIQSNYADEPFHKCFVHEATRLQRSICQSGIDVLQRQRFLDSWTVGGRPCRSFCDVHEEETTFLYFNLSSRAEQDRCRTADLICSGERLGLGFHTQILCEFKLTFLDSPLG